MASPPNQAGPPQVPSAFSPTTMTVTLSSSSASETAHTSTVTTIDSTIASTQTTGQPQSSSQSSKVGLNTLQITAIAVGSSILVLALVAGIVYWLFVRREKRRQSAAATRTLGATEKYGQDSEYTPTFSYNQIPKDHGGTDPLIKSPTARSRAISGLSYISSQYDNESRRFPSEDAPSSRFINGEDEIIQIPLSHAISLSDAIPNAQPDESLLDSASLLPYLTRSPSKHLPDLPIAPDTSPPTRRSSRRKNPNPWRGSGYDSDETDSMYSQASASTVKLYDAPSATAIHELPASLVPATTFTPSSSQQMPYIPVTITLEDEHEQKQLADENNLLVARLLMSRTKNAPGQPSRNSSIISHIERSGSIKPVLESESGETRGVRHLQKLRAKESKKSYKPRLSTTAMLEEPEVSTPPRSPSG
jgi:hypothetical protein